MWSRCIEKAVISRLGGDVSAPQAEFVRKAGAKLANNRDGKILTFQPGRKAPLRTNMIEDALADIDTFSAGEYARLKCVLSDHLARRPCHCVGWTQA
jgi:hypothetical protein